MKSQVKKVLLQNIFLLQRNLIPDQEGVEILGESLLLKVFEWLFCEWNVHLYVKKFFYISVLEHICTVQWSCQVTYSCKHTYYLSLRVTPRLNEGGTLTVLVVVVNRSGNVLRIKARQDTLHTYCNWVPVCICMCKTRLCCCSLHYNDMHAYCWYTRLHLKIKFVVENKFSRIKLAFVILFSNLNS